MNRYERKKRSVEKAIREQIEGYKAIYKKAEEDDRDPTDDERLEIESHLKAIETLRAEKDEAEENIKTLQRVDDFGRELGVDKEDTTDPAPGIRVTPGGDRIDRMVASIGEQFTSSKGYKAVQDPASRGQTYTTGPVEMNLKGTLLEGAGGGGGAIGNTVPMVVPGVTARLFQRLTVADLILSGQTSAPTIRYVVEGTATSGAAGVAEGGAKPESTLGLTTTDEPVKKIATTLVVSDEMLEDAQQVQSYINGRLSLFVQIEEERQLIRGAAGGNEVQGIMNGRSINVYAGGTAVGNKAVQLFKAMNGQRGSALLEPDWIAINPTDWEAIRLLTDTAGQFFGGGPFQGPYGNGRNLDPSNQVSGADEFIWNKPVIVTAALGAGTALVGTRAAAQVYRRSGLSVEASNSHQDYFTKNLVAIRAEERLGLAVYRPSAFTDVRLA